MVLSRLRDRLGRFRDRITRTPRKETVDIKPETREPVRVVDRAPPADAPPEQQTAGGVVVRGGTGRAGGGGRVTRVDQPDDPSQRITPQEAQQLARTGPQQLTTQQRIAAAETDERVRRGALVDTRMQTQEIPPRELPGVRSIDIADEGRPGTIGGVTFRGRDVFEREAQVRDIDDDQVEVRLETPDQEFSRKQQSATDLVFGEPQRRTFADDPSFTVTELADAEAAADQTFLTRVATSPDMQRSARLIDFETEATRREVFEASGLPGVVRSTFFKLGKDVGAVAQRIGVPERFATRGGKVVGDVALFAAFSPAFATTTQIQRQIAEVSRVNVAGVSKGVGKGRVRTEAIFTVTRAGKRVKGVAAAESAQRTIQRTVITQLKGGGKAITTRPERVVVSGVRAQRVRTGVRFPTGKQVIRPVGKQIKGAEVATVTRRGELFFTRAAGRADGRPFIAGGVSRRAGDLIAQVGATITKEGKKSFTTGVFKVRTAPTRTGIGITTRGRPGPVTKPVSPELTALNLQAIKDTVSKSVQIPLTAPKPFVVAPITRPAVQEQVRPVTTQIQTTTPVQTVSPSQEFIKQFQIARVEQQTAQRPKQVTRTVQAQVPAQREIQRAITTPVQIPAQRIQQRVATVPAFLQKQITRQRQLVPRVPTPKIRFPRTPFVVPKLEPARQITPPVTKFPVLVRRFGEFRIAGFGRTPGEAVGIGKDIVSKTLAATFKVRGAGITKVPGFRTKKEDGKILFIEPRKRRLGTGGEIAEIQGFLKKSTKPRGRRKRR